MTFVCVFVGGGGWVRWNHDLSKRKTSISNSKLYIKNQQISKYPAISNSDLIFLFVFKKYFVSIIAEIVGLLLQT